jgi:hypothetical protein
LAIGGLVHENWAKHYLLSDQFDAWHGRDVAGE